MSIVRDLIDLQRGIGKRNVGRRREGLTKKLIASPCRQFQVTDHMVNRGSNIFTFMHCGRLFRQQSLQANKEVVCSCAYPSRTETKKKGAKFVHQKLFTFPCNFKCKDLVIWSPDSPIATENLLLHKERHSTSLLYLEKSSYLVRLCCLTGQVKERIFLSQTLKFNEISSDSESDIIALKSTRSKDSTGAGDVVFTMAIFTSPPLKFLAMFEIKSSVFGKKIQDAGVSQGLIFIRYYDDKVAMYSLDSILQKCIVTRVEAMEEEEKSRIGLKPFGLPLNAEVSEQQPTLFQVDSHQGELVIGSYPWHSITKKSATQLEIRNLFSGELVDTFEYSSHFAGMEVEHLFFHPDDSKRLIHICNNKLSINKLSEQGMIPWQVYSEEAPGLTRRLQENSTTRSGRTVLLSVAAREAAESRIMDQENMLTHDFSISLDHETNIFAIFSVAAKGPEQLKMNRITLFDNTTGKLLKWIDLDSVQNSSIFNVTCNLTLEGINIFAEVRDKSFMQGALLNLVEVF